MTTPTSAPTTYRLSGAHALRLVAPVVVLVGGAWVVGALAGVLDTVGVGLAVATAVVAVAAGALVARPPRVLLLSDTGYRVAWVRGAGVQDGSWSEVEAVETRRVADVACLVITLVDDRNTIVPLSLLGFRSPEARREVHERLNTAHGYRPLEQ